MSTRSPLSPARLLAFSPALVPPGLCCTSQSCIPAPRRLLGLTPHARSPLCPVSAALCMTSGAQTFNERSSGSNGVPHSRTAQSPKEQHRLRSRERFTADNRRNDAEIDNSIAPQQVAPRSQPSDREVFFDGLTYPPHELDWCTTSSDAFEMQNGASARQGAGREKGEELPETYGDDEPCTVMQPCMGGAMFRQRVDRAFVDTFRMSSPYINAHRGRVFVVHLPGSLLSEENFSSVMEDLALMHIVGVKLVLVLGPRFQIERRLGREDELESKFVGSKRVTDEKTLQIVKEAAGGMLFEVESKLTRGVVNAPSLSSISVVSGNFYTAQPLGVLGGEDFGYTGKVRRIDGDAIEKRLSQGDIVILPNVGYSPTGQLFNCQSEEVAGACASALAAEKLIFMANGESIYDKRNQKPIPNLTLTTATKFLQLQADNLPPHFEVALSVSVNALHHGVTRAHVLNRLIDGVLLMEVFHRDGVGLMVSRDLYEGIRFARLQDVAGIEAIVHPLEEKGVLVKRGRASIEKAINQFIVVERDGMIIACLSLQIMADDPSWAELGCFVVHHDYRRLGKGDAMLGFCERYALKKGVSNLFILSTVTFQWFLERRFEEVTVESLPPSRQAAYDVGRNSKIYRKLLSSSRAVDEEEVLKHLG